MKTKRAAAPRGAGGYSFVEMMATLCVAGVVLSYALPSFDALVLNQRRAAVVNDLLATLLLARSETLKRNGRPLVVCGVDDADRSGSLDPAELRCAGRDWSDGWMLATWTDADGNGAVGAGESEPLRLFPTGAGGRFTVTGGNFTASPPVAPAGTMLIKSFGRRTSNGTITVCDRRGPEAARGVIVSSLGRARVSARRADGTPLRCP